VLQFNIQGEKRFKGAKSGPKEEIETEEKQERKE
jgi:hypothetical protein